MKEKHFYPALSLMSICAMLIKTLTTQNSFIQQLWKKSDASYAIRIVTSKAIKFFSSFNFTFNSINVKYKMKILNNCFSTIWSVILQKPLVSEAKR